VSVNFPATNRIANVDAEPTAGVVLLHVIPLMDLILEEASVLYDGQRLHSPVVPSDRMEKAKRKEEGKDKNDEDEDGVLRPPVVASGSIKGPLHAWQSTEYSGAKR
jgi:hypothetical protein